MPADEVMPQCPWCGRRNQIYPHGEREYWCRRCNRVFDDDPDEGGDYYSDPSRRMERREELRRRPRYLGEG